MGTLPSLVASYSKQLLHLLHCMIIDDPPPRSTVYVPPTEPFLLLPPLTGGCRKRFDGFMKGVISSPGFPDQYSTNQDCEWQIRVPIGFQIRFDFVKVDLHER